MEQELFAEKLYSLYSKKDDWDELSKNEKEKWYLVACEVNNEKNDRKKDKKNALLSNIKKEYGAVIEQINPPVNVGDGLVFFENKKKNTILAVNVETCQLSILRYILIKRSRLGSKFIFLIFDDFHYLATVSELNFPFGFEKKYSILIFYRDEELD